MSDIVDYLDDGYTAKVTIPAEDGVHGALAVEYRPCLAAEQSKMFDVMDKKGNEASTIASIELAASHIAKWDKTDRNGKDVPANKTTLARLAPKLLNKLLDAVIYGKLPEGVKADLEADLKN